MAACSARLASSSVEVFSSVTVVRQFSVPSGRSTTAPSAVMPSAGVICSVPVFQLAVATCCHSPPTRASSVKSGQWERSLSRS